MQIRRAGIGKHIRVAGLQGHVMAGGEGHIHGLLLEALSDGEGCGADTMILFPYGSDGMRMSLE
jgi:hypothetical protein